MDAAQSELSSVVGIQKKAFFYIYFSYLGRFIILANSGHIKIMGR
ncbi:hypothetical protein K036_3581 [Acinetobacter baumannii 42057_5]|nr:hypothetical protein ACINWCA694_0435 [Acinetobacter baumannii WC-A-694]KCZ18788.1 hypothetical protein K036_3581 [Acinetobacter baumannii 42057_5]